MPTPNQLFSDSAAELKLVKAHLEWLKAKQAIQELGEMAGETEEGGPGVDGQAGESLLLVYKALRHITEVLNSLLPELTEAE